MDYNLKIGSVVKFNSLVVTDGWSNDELIDITVGKEYTIIGFDEDGDLFFIDDVGEADYAAISDDGVLDMTVVSY